jgi:hypothetical protein
LPAQTINGKVVDNKGVPIKGVAVVLQSIDSTLLEAAETDSLGMYNFSRPKPEKYRLIFQHLSYNSYVNEFSKNDLPTIILEERDYSLPGFDVKADYPTIRVEKTKIIYDAVNLNKQLISINAYDFIKSFPGIIENNDKIELIGASKLKIIIDDNLSTLDYDQTLKLLKSMPASRIDKVEIMFSAPSKYNFNGAVLNVVLNDDKKESANFKGEIGTEYSQAYYPSGSIYSNLHYSNSRFSSNILLDFNQGRIRGGEDMNALHTLADRTVSVIQKNIRNEKMLDASVMGEFGYSFNNRDKATASYYFNRNDNTTFRSGRTDFIDVNPTTNDSESENNDKSSLNNIRVQYDSHRKFQLWGDYTLYLSPSDLHFENHVENKENIVYNNKVKQRVYKWAFGANKDYSISQNWEVNYGAIFSLEHYKDRINSSVEGYINELKAKENLQNDRQKELSSSIFADFYGSVTENLGISVGVSGEYFNSKYYSDLTHTTLWNKFLLNPSMALNYRLKNSDLIQLNVTSDKAFPSFWEMSNQVSPLNAYSYAFGNPKLLTSYGYNGQLAYYLKSKYIFMAFCNFEPKKFVQMPYQSQDELSSIFITENLDFSLRYGLSVVLNSNLFDFWNLQSTFQGFHNRNKKDNFFNIDIDNRGWVGSAILNNTFTIPENKNFQFNIRGIFVTKGLVQGLYKLGSSFNLSSSIKYKMSNDKLSIVLRVNDILNKGIPNARVKYGTQNSILKKKNENRYVLVSLIWNFNDYKTGKFKDIDTSRYQK